MFAEHVELIYVSYRFEKVNFPKVFHQKFRTRCRSIVTKIKLTLVHVGYTC